MGQNKVKLFTTVGRSQAAPVHSVTYEEWVKLREDKRLKQMVEKIQQAKDEEEVRRLKSQLPVWTPRAHSFRGGKRREKNIQGRNPFLMIDIDEKGHTDEVVGKMLNGRLGGYPVVMVEDSVREGTHILLLVSPEDDPTEVQARISMATGLKVDSSVKNPAGCIYMVPMDHVRYIVDDVCAHRQESALPAAEEEKPANPSAAEDKKVVEKEDSKEVGAPAAPLSYEDIPYERIISKWWQMYNHGAEPFKSNRNALTFELAVNLRNICGFDRNLMDRVIPCYDGFSQEEKMQCIDSAIKERRTQMPTRLRNVLDAVRRDIIRESSDSKAALDMMAALDDVEAEDALAYYRRFRQGALPMAVQDSVQSVGPTMVMPVLATVLPMVGALASDVYMTIHGKVVSLSWCAFVCGQAASGKQGLDALVRAWMYERIRDNKVYFAQEREYRRRVRQSKNTKSQPDEVTYPILYQTLNTTMANLAQRLENAGGKHVFSFTPEADDVTAKFQGRDLIELSSMLRKAYDSSSYSREAKTVEATSVHIEKLLWNVVMTGTLSAMLRLIRDYTDGLLSRMMIAHTPDNTFAPLEEEPYLMTPQQEERIHQVAHLLPFMKGILNLPRLEQRSRQWVERLRLEALKNDDRVLARARMRDHETALRATAAIVLCCVAEELIQEHGLQGAEEVLKSNPGIVPELALKCETPALLEAYDAIADSMIENDMLFFREKLEQAYDTVNVSSIRIRGGKNDSIFERLGKEFSFEEALTAKGSAFSRNSVSQMLKNWKKQGLIKPAGDKQYVKLRE